jgi:uncharacterized membrane protein
MTTTPATPETLPPTRRLPFTLWHVTMVTVVLGLFISGYLSYTRLFNTATACAADAVFNCDYVTTSIYSQLFGIPVAYLGFAVYVILGVLLLTEQRFAFMQEYGVMLQFGLSLFAWLFSMWLVYVQFFLLERLCPWCLSHEANFTVLFAVVCVRLYHSLK